MNARTQSTVLVSCGAVLIRLATGGALARYVRPGTRPLVIAAGVVIAVLALWRLLDIRRRDAAASGSRAGWLILAPVLAIAVVAPPALGAFTADRRPAVPPRPHGALPALPATGTVPMAVGDVVVRAIWDGGRSLRGHRLRTIGFVSRAAPHGFVLTRLVITCCAADAEPENVEIVASGPAPPRNAWVTVTGRFVGVSPSDSYVPVLTADGVRPTAAPADPYE